jgi:peptidoglycan/LPS O-acetylase OafA/YrhL
MAVAKQADHFTSLTALRGIAALLVLLFHAAIWGFSPYFVSATSFAVKGYLWVDFFFLLSGFVMAHAYGSAFAERIRLRPVASYLVARFARIYPLHLATLLVLVVVEFVRVRALGGFVPLTHAGLHFTLPSLFANLFLVQSLLYPSTTWNEPAWSISSEAAVYLVFPLLAAIAARRRMLAPIIAVCAAALAGIYFQRDPMTLGFGCIRCAAEFTVGLCLYRLYVDGRFPALVMRDGVALAVVLVLALSLHFGLFDLLIVPQLCALLMVAAANRARFAAILSTPVPQFLGRISYSIYLVHWPAFYVAALAVQRMWGREVILRQPNSVRVAVLLAAAPIIVALAALSYRYVEMPCRKWLTQRSRPAALDPLALPPAPAAPTEPVLPA